MKLNIIGYKSKDTEELQELKKQLKTAIDVLTWDDPVKKALQELKDNISYELRKREKSKKVLVKFTAEWSGYTAKQKRDCAVEYRKIDRALWDKMDKTFIHNFPDNTYNLWRMEIVHKKDEPAYNSYGSQVDRFLEEQIKKNN